jgi:3',5'-cyclic AMP phosphodiesterase CpdA
MGDFAMPRIVLISDIHLSPRHGFFWANWCVARDFANGTQCDAVIVNGDLAIDGPDSDAEIAFGAEALAGLTGKVLALPGNHDVGDEPPGQDPGQIISETRLARWDRSLGGDRFVLNLDGWRLVGVNAQLFGSGLSREAEQNRWLDAQLLSPAGRRLALVLHKPLFIEHAGEDVPSIASIVPAARGALLDRLKRAGVRLVVSGHLHQHRDRVIDGIRHLWLPSTAFMASEPRGGDPACGLAILDLTADQVSVSIERPAGLVSHDLKAIKGPHRFLREMPPAPPPLAA